MSFVPMTSYNLFAVSVNQSLYFKSCMCFVKMDKAEYGEVIKFFVLDELSSKEIYPKLAKVYGNSTPFKNGQLNLNVATRPSKMTFLRDG